MLNDPRSTIAQLEKGIVAKVPILLQKYFDHPSAKH